MKIKVLGCSGAELPRHHFPAYLLDGTILFDAGSLTQVLNRKEQMMIQNIFVTHAHLDHIRGIPFLADNILIENQKRKVNILSIPSVLKTMKKHLLNNSVWPDFTVIPNARLGILDLIPLKLGQAVHLEGYTITPYEVLHSVPAVGYLLKDQQGKRLFYTGDTGPSQTVWQKIGHEKLHGLIIEVSMPNGMEKIAVKTGHLTPQLLEEELSKLADLPERIYITHPKPQYLNLIRIQLKSLRQKNLKLLRDGQTITL